MSDQKVIKVGNSLGITLPSALVKSLSLKIGDKVEVLLDSGNVLRVSFPDIHQLSFDLTRTKKSKKSI